MQAHLLESPSSAPDGGASSSQPVAATFASPITATTGPSFNLKIHNKYQTSHDHDFCTNFLSKDRIFVRSLLEVLFCRSSFSALGLEAIGLEEVVTSVDFDQTVEKRKLEISYSTGLDEDDSILFIIQGYGKEPNAFIFQHYVSWVKKRLMASHKGPVSYRIEARAD